MNIIGYQLPPQKRKDYWEAMQLFKKGSIELKKNKDTIKIALEDEMRYKRFLSVYIEGNVEGSTRH